MLSMTLFVVVYVCFSLSPVSPIRLFFTSGILFLFYVFVLFLLVGEVLLFVVLIPRFMQVTDL